MYHARHIKLSFSCAMSFEKIALSFLLFVFSYNEFYILSKRLRNDERKDSTKPEQQNQIVFDI